MVTKRSRVRSSRRRQQPLEVRLSLKVVFGPEVGAAVQVIDDRRIPMVGSVFSARDRIVRGFATAIVKAAATQPRVLRHLMPALDLISRRRP